MQLRCKRLQPDRVAMYNGTTSQRFFFWKRTRSIFSLEETARHSRIGTIKCRKNAACAAHQRNGTVIATTKQPLAQIVGSNKLTR